MAGPRRHSRHIFTIGKLDTAGRRFLTEREPYRFVELNDNIRHLVVEGDTWETIADRYYSGLEQAALFWWAIPDFQPEPIVDPTIPPAAGSVVVVPSLRTVQEIILAESRRSESAT